MAATYLRRIRSSTYVERGLQAQARFRTETSMRDAMTRALSPSTFGRLVMR